MLCSVAMPRSLSPQFIESLAPLCGYGAEN
jgi:hypothetical protein